MTEEKYDVILRLRAIELLAYWEGRLVTNRLIAWFGISRQQASSDIKRYNVQCNPNSLIHDPSVKGYVPVSGFQPILTTGHVNEYLDMLSGMVSESHALIAIPEKHILAVQLPDRSVRPEVLREVLKACRNGTSLKIIYASMNNPVWHERVISPHTLVYTGFRWHVRAYCHKSQAFKDFLLSRIDRTPQVVEQKSVDVSQDYLWNEEVVLTLVPNPKLTQNQKMLIEKDFGMPDGRLQIAVKKALAHYSLQRYQVTINAQEASDALKYPLVLQTQDADKVLPFLLGQSFQGE